MRYLGVRTRVLDLLVKELEEVKPPFNHVTLAMRLERRLAEHRMLSTQAMRDRVFADKSFAHAMRQMKREVRT